jgi:hypothetical protein
MAIASMLDAMVASAIVDVNGESFAHEADVVASASQKLHSEPVQDLIRY